jgi:very-short-patch-repair endonuclease
VQGDERDAIILSFGYAKDGAGNLLNRLGPINQMGGERRLNVAVTRAKTRMTVVSTFTENDMDRSRFSSRGAQVLSRYLAYARTGGTRLDDVQETEVEMNEFERDVMDTLTSKGLRLVPQLGVSKYRLDFAVNHPNIPNKYVLAIECDGAPYHSSATARDRDRLRQAHLESRGWRFHRIWSLDWYEQRASEIDRVLEAYAVAVAESERSAKAETTPSIVSTNTESAARAKARSAKPYVWPSSNIYHHSEDEIQRVIEWICSDGILRSDDEILMEAVPALGFQRRGRLVDERLRESVARWRRNR